MSSVSLLIVLVKDRPEWYDLAYSKAIRRLRQLLQDGVNDPDYAYYGLPDPWLQVKLIKFLQCFPPPDDLTLAEQLDDVLGLIVDDQKDSHSQLQQSNVSNAVLYEGINLALHISSPLIIDKALKVLRSHIVSKETNVRYLGLETLANLASHTSDHSPLQQYQQIILGSLKDRDVSVRRRGLDLLFNMSNESNAEWIVDNLISSLHQSDASMREEMVLKIAVLAEKFATESQWYVDSALKLISAAGDEVPDEVWYRIVQIVTNNESIQAYSAETVMRYLGNPIAHETIVKTSSYILGEFGHLIANEDNASPIRQFMALSSKLRSSSNQTKAIILSTFAKFINLFPEIHPQIIRVLEEYASHIDAELQQRASEYLMLAKVESLLQTTFEEMPAFPARESALLGRLHTKPNGHVPNLQQLTLNDTRKASADVSTDMLSVGWQAGFNKLIWRTSETFYEDDLMKIDLKSQYSGNRGRLALRFSNLIGQDLSSFTAKVSGLRQLEIRTSELATPELEAGNNTIITVDIECQDVFSEAPVIKVSWISGSAQSLLLKLPVVPSKFMTPAPISREDEESRWDILGQNTTLQYHETSQVMLGRAMSRERSQIVMEGFNLHTWAEENILYGAAVFKCANRNVGVLVHLHCSDMETEFTLDVRTTDSIISSSLGVLLLGRLQVGIRQ